MVLTVADHNGNTTTMATLSSYTPTGKIGQIEHPNNTATSYTYDPKSTRLLGIITTSPASNGQPINDVINREYYYSPAGDILSTTDYKKGQELGLPGNVFVYEYQYDQLHRYNMTGAMGSDLFIGVARRRVAHSNG